MLGFSLASLHRHQQQQHASTVTLSNYGTDKLPAIHQCVIAYHWPHQPSRLISHGSILENGDLHSQYEILRFRNKKHGQLARPDFKWLQRSV